MKKKQKFILGFVIVIMTIFTLVGCEMPEDATFPSEFIGLWERAFQTPFTTTLTFSSTSLKASNQSYRWELQEVSGDRYKIKIPDGSSHTGLTTITIKYMNGNLDIIDRESDATSSGWTGTESDWTGIWKKK